LSRATVTPSSIEPILLVLSSLSSRNAPLAGGFSLDRSFFILSLILNPTISMAKIGLFFGTQTGNTETVAEMIQKEFGGESIVDLNDISSASTEDFAPYDALIIGCPTWNIGELQSDWEGFYDELDEIDFSTKKVAYFGTGDQIGYADNFQDAMGILEDLVFGRKNGRLPVYRRIRF
jgi:flavodoxin